MTTTFEQMMEGYEEWKVRQTFDLEPADYDAYLNDQEKLGILADLKELVERDDVTLEDVRGILRATGS